MKKHKVCIITTMTGMGGIEKVLIDFLNCDIRNLPFDVRLLTTSSNKKIISKINNFEEIWYQPDGTFRYDPRRLFKIVQYYTREGIDIVHSRDARGNSWSFLSNILSINPPLMITGEHGSIWNITPPISWLNYFANKKAKFIIVNSKASALMVEKLCNISPSKIRVIYNGLIVNEISKQNARQKFGFSPELKIVGSVGRLQTEKNYPIYIETAIEVLKQRQDVIFLLVGDGPFMPFLRDMVFKAGISDKFIFFGNRFDAQDIIATFDIFVSTSIRESFGNVLVEAAFLEKPVIAPKVDGIPEVVTDGFTGILLEPNERVKKTLIEGANPYPRWVVRNGNITKPLSLNPLQLAEKIIFLLDNEQIRFEMGKLARVKALQNFNLGRYAIDLQKVYLEALS